MANTKQSVRETAEGKTEKAPELRGSLHLNRVLKSALDEMSSYSLPKLYTLDLKDHLPHLLCLHLADKEI